MNPNADIPVKFLQIWVIPNKRNVEPRYQQITIADNANQMISNKFYHQIQMMKVFGFIKMRGFR